MRISIEFEYTASLSVGRIRDFQSGRELLSFRIDFAPKKRPPQLHGLGVQSAIGASYRNLYPAIKRHFKQSGDAYRDPRAFEREFLELVKSHILDQVTQRKVVLIPTNYLEEIWTTDQIKSIAKRLGRKPNPKFFRQRELEELLSTHWEKASLFNMDRYELAEWVNVFARGLFDNKPFKPSAVWQCAARLELVSKREKGPKPRVA